LLDFDGLGVFLELLDHLLPLHEVVAVLPVYHEELGVSLDVLSNDHLMRVPDL
jgi:hypothetical protein